MRRIIFCIATVNELKHDLGAENGIRVRKGLWMKKQMGSWRNYDSRKFGNYFDGDVNFQWDCSMSSHD
jgi:hypothetical protein